MSSFFLLVQRQITTYTIYLSLNHKLHAVPMGTMKPYCRMSVSESSLKVTGGIFLQCGPPRWDRVMPMVQSRLIFSPRIRQKHIMHCATTMYWIIVYEQSSKHSLCNFVTIGA